jgi:RimJ/RimL family protein N-acetyltransferase
VRIPLVQDYWIGRTFVHVADDAPAAALPPGVEFRAMVPRDLEEIAESNDPQLRRRNAQMGACIRRFGAWISGRLVGVCTFAFGEEYHGYYRLQAGEAELADIFITSECRGKGAATALIRYGTDAMLRSGFRTLHAKVWHNNTPSTKAFLRAGWTRQCFFVRVQPVGTSRAIYVQWPLFRRSSPGRAAPGLS